MNKQIIPVHTESIDSNESLETCIICLDDVDVNTIHFPCEYSSCSCKYTIHLICIKDNHINECVICKSPIRYPVPNDLIQIDMFELNHTNNRESHYTHRELMRDNSTDIDIYRHQTYEDCHMYCYNCCYNRKTYICIFSSVLFIGIFGFVIWYISARFPGLILIGDQNHTE
jgi:hypothetical protein